MTPTSILRDAIRLALAEGAMTPDQRLAAQANYLGRMRKILAEQRARQAEMIDYAAIVEMLGAPERPTATVLKFGRRGG